MKHRTNAEWLEELEALDPLREDALRDLREGILRAVRAYLAKQFVGRGSLSAEEAHHLAEDCTQETLLAIRSNLAGFRGDSQFTTWGLCHCDTHRASGSAPQALAEGQAGPGSPRATNSGVAPGRTFDARPRPQFSTARGMADLDASHRIGSHAQAARRARRSRL